MKRYGYLYEKVYASGTVTITAGDRIWCKFENQTDAQDLLYEHGNVTLHKL